MYPAIQMNQTAINNGARMISTKGKEVPLTETTVRAVARGGVARVIVTQTFQNIYEEALSVTYQLPLPADGAVSGFSFLLQDRRVVGEVDRKSKARERFQRAVSEGRSAALLEQDRSSVFTQEIGNIPPRSRIVAEIEIDQRLLWLPEGSWEWRFPTVVAPKYLGEAGRVADAQKISALVSQEPLAARLSFDIEVRDELFGSPSSPSHDLNISEGEGGVLLSLAERATRANQDVVVRWPVSGAKVGAQLSTCRPELGGLDHFGFGLLTLVPPRGESQYVARDLILLLDVSGSMSGSPIHQLKEVSRALINSLQERDQLEIVVFADSTKRWKRGGAVFATEENKSLAINWINKLEASGGTEMKKGIIEALAPIRRDSQRQVIIMTDGHIGFEDEIIREVYHRLPQGSRVHTLGIGSSVNRSLTSPVARAGGGVEQIVGLNESAQKAAERLLERTNAPVVVGLRLGGEALIEAKPSRFPDLFAASPSLLSVKLRPEGGSFWVEGYCAEGLFRHEMQVKPLSPNQGEQSIAALYAREAVEDLEMSICAGKNKAEADQEIESIGVAFQIATRLTSWVAISQDVTVDPELATRHEVVPQELPAGMNAAALGLRPVRSSSAPSSAISGKSVVRKRMVKEVEKDITQTIVVDKERAMGGEGDSLSSGEALFSLFESEEIAIDSDDITPEKSRAPMREDREKREESDGKKPVFRSLPPVPRPSPMEPMKSPARGQSQRSEKKEEKQGKKSAPIWKGSFTGQTSLSCGGSLFSRREDGSWAISFEIPANFAWNPSLEATLTLLSGGSAIKVQVNLTQSTPSGVSAVLREVELVFIAPQFTGGPAKLSFFSNNTMVSVIFS